MKEYKVGEIFEHDGKVFQCVEDSTEVGCGSCCALRGDCGLFYCMACERQDKTDIHFICVTELREGMLFRAKSGELYRIAADLKDGEKCVCETGNRYSCSDIKRQIPVSLLAGYKASRLLFIPVDGGEEPEIPPVRRHIGIAVDAVEDDKVVFRIAEQTHRGRDFGDQPLKHRFDGTNGCSLISALSPCCDFKLGGHRLYVRGECESCDNDKIEVSPEHFARIMEVVTEYNLTDGKGYEKPWPKKGDTYYYVSHIGRVESFPFEDCLVDKEMRSFGNFFRTREEAEAALERVKKALRAADAE